jgi:caa(3)-type oxidase subunit IV
MTETTDSTRLYLIIWGWLAGLMLLGVLVSERPILPLAKAGIVALVVVLSTVKAVLVAMYYMHLKMDRRALLFIIGAPFVLVTLVLGLLFSSTLVRL